MSLNMQIVTVKFNVVQYFLFNIIHNLWVIDGAGITASGVNNSRISRRNTYMPGGRRAGIQRTIGNIGIREAVGGTV
jgi:hypothetical protein